MLYRLCAEASDWTDCAAPAASIPSSLCAEAVVQLHVDQLHVNHDREKASASFEQKCSM